MEQFFGFAEVLVHHIIVWFRWIGIYLFKKPSNVPLILSTFGHFLSYLKVRVDIAGGDRASYEIKRSMRCLYCIETRGKMELLILTYATSDISMCLLLLYYLLLCRTCISLCKVRPTCSSSSWLKFMQCQDRLLID